MATNTELICLLILVTMQTTLLSFDIIESTNTEALNQARVGAEEGLCIVARQQTAGRGRHGRVWVSEKDAGLYFSIILRPRIESKHLPLITLMTGIAVYETLNELGIDPDIKWVNDIHVNEKKICGVLAETTETVKGIAVVVGIGINIRASNYPPEISKIATSIETELPEIAIKNNFGQELTSILINNLKTFYKVLSGSNGHIAIVQEWGKRSTYFKGKAVNVTLGEDVVSGITDGIEENGALRLKLDDGSIQIVHSGEVERVRAKAL